MQIGLAALKSKYTCIIFVLLSYRWLPWDPNAKIALVNCSYLHNFILIFGKWALAAECREKPKTTTIDKLNTNHKCRINSNRFRLTDIQWNLDVVRFSSPSISFIFSLFISFSHPALLSLVLVLCTSCVND